MAGPRDVDGWAGNAGRRMTTAENLSEYVVVGPPVVEPGMILRVDEHDGIAADTAPAEDAIEGDSRHGQHLRDDPPDGRIVTRLLVRIMWVSVAAGKGAIFAGQSEPAIGLQSQNSGDTIPNYPWSHKIPGTSSKFRGHHTELPLESCMVSPEPRPGVPGTLSTSDPRTEGQAPHFHQSSY